MNFSYSHPVLVRVAQGGSHQLANLMPDQYRNILLLTTSPLREARLITPIVKSLQESGRDVAVIGDLNLEPTTNAIADARDRLSGTPPDALVAIGGGSVIDFAKALAIALVHPGNIWDYTSKNLKDPGRITERTLPLFCVPTTAGTGAEATPYAVIINEKTKQKGTIKSPLIYPRAVILDAVLTSSMSPALTATTALDALAHALESYVSKANEGNKVIEMLSLEAIEKIARHLPLALANAADLDARENLLWASYLAGMSIAQGGTAAAHAFAQSLGALTGLPHGLTVAIFTLPVAEVSMPCAQEKWAKVAMSLAKEKLLPCGTRERALAGIDMLSTLIRDTPLTLTLRAQGIEESIVQKLYQDVRLNRANSVRKQPGNFSDRVIEEICHAVY